MLSFFRQRGLSSVLYGAIIIATILTFVIEFRPNASSRTGSLSEACVARVRGRCIDPKDFSAAYRMMMPARSAAASRRLNMKRQALDGLVERELLVDEAGRLGITVSDTEVTDQLYSGYVRVSVPAADPQTAETLLNQMFQSYAGAGMMSNTIAQAQLANGDAAIPVDFRDPKTKIFDMKTYERQVRNLTNRSTTEFREEQARELLAAKMRDVVRAPVRLSDTETWDEYERRYSTASVTWIPVKEAWAARWAVDTSPADVDAWAKDHQKEIDDAANERQKDDAPTAGHVRQIVAKVPYGATEDEKALAVAKLSWAAARVKAGEAFAEVARDVSEDAPTASVGGDVGADTSKNGPAFKAATDALKPGETSIAIESQYGYHLARKDDPSKAADVTERVKRSVARSLYAKAKATDAAKQIAKTIDDAIRAGKSGEDAVAAATAPYVRDTKAEMLKVIPASADASEPGAAAPARAKADAGAATGDAGAPSSPSHAGPATITLPARRFDASTDADRPKDETSSAFNRGGDPFAGLSPETKGAVVDFAFSAKDGDVMADPIRRPDGFAVVRLKQHELATREKFEKDKGTLEQDLLRIKRDQALSLYVRRLRERAKDDIKIERSYIEEAKGDGGAPMPGEDEDEP